MKKKTALFILSILVILLGILMFSSKIDFIKSIENIKSKKVEEKEITKIDVTDLEDGGIIEHEHIFKTMYDENKHWEECTICEEKQYEFSHRYKTTWALGYESCIYNNSYTNACDCGYSYIGHKPCVWNGTYSTFASGSHYSKCNICKGPIRWSYYKNTYGVGNIYYDILEGGCFSSNGTRLVCGNKGRCVTCGYNHDGSGSYHLWLENENGELICNMCNTKYGYVLNKSVSISGTEPFTNTYIVDIVAYKNSTVECNINNAFWNQNVVDLSKSSQTLTYLDSTKLKYRVTTVAKVTSKNTSTSILTLKWRCNYGTLNGYGNISMDYLADNTPPTVQVKSDVELTEWSKTKPITITGIENYCSNVDVKILDNEENIIFQGITDVTNKNYTISCVPLLEIDTSGKNFKAIVTDTYGNSTETEFEIARVDSISPIATSSDEITGEWTKLRKFTFKATDGGVGEVSIAFNDIEDLGLAKFNEEEYSRDYEFYGDVYQPKQLSVLYRDKLGNTSIQKVTIDKLDNTAPTITNAGIHNNVVSIVANDVHEKLGEGSGLVKYRYITSAEKLNNPDVLGGKEISASEKIVIDEIYKFKYVYIEAEDLVGNVSEVYEFKIPELVLTSRVDSSLADGKGGVILDWSTYDVEDKYFVVYRKEENAIEWETIVSLEEKLTGSGYTDILANDKNEPNVPNINISGDAQNNNIKINATSSDNGAKYSYYIEAYDDNKNLLQTSIK